MSINIHCLQPIYPTRKWMHRDLGRRTIAVERKSWQVSFWGKKNRLRVTFQWVQRFFIYFFGGRGGGGGGRKRRVKKKGRWRKSRILFHTNITHVLKFYVLSSLIIFFFGYFQHKSFSRGICHRSVFQSIIIIFFGLDVVCARGRHWSFAVCRLPPLGWWTLPTLWFPIPKTQDEWMNTWLKPWMNSFSLISVYFCICIVS